MAAASAPRHHDVLQEADMSMVTRDAAGWVDSAGDAFEADRVAHPGVTLAEYVTKTQAGLGPILELLSEGYLSAALKLPLKSFRPLGVIRTSTDSLKTIGTIAADLTAAAFIGRRDVFELLASRVSRLLDSVEAIVMKADNKRVDCLASIFATARTDDAAPADAATADSAPGFFGEDLAAKAANKQIRFDSSNIFESVAGISAADVAAELVGVIAAAVAARRVVACELIYPPLRLICDRYPLGKMPANIGRCTLDHAILTKSFETVAWTLMNIPEAKSALLYCDASRRLEGDAPGMNEWVRRFSRGIALPGQIVWAGKDFAAKGVGFDSRRMPFMSDPAHLDHPDIFRAHLLMHCTAAAGVPGRIDEDGLIERFRLVAWRVFSMRGDRALSYLHSLFLVPAMGDDPLVTFVDAELVVKFVDAAASDAAAWGKADYAGWVEAVRGCLPSFAKAAPAKETPA